MNQVQGVLEPALIGLAQYGPGTQLPSPDTGREAALGVGLGLGMALIWVAGLCLLSFLLIMLPTLFRRRRPGH